MSDFYEENTPVARRRLRTTIERHGLGINEQFLAAAEAIIRVKTYPVLIAGTSVHRPSCMSEMHAQIYERKV